MNLKEFLESKKAKAFLTGLVALVCTNLLNWSPEKVAKLTDAILYLTSAYLAAQGAADFGKEKTAIEVKALPPAAAPALPPPAPGQ